MDIGQVSIAMSTAKTATDVSFAVLGKMMDVMEMEGAMLTDMMQSLTVPSDPNIGSNIDITV